MIDECTGKKIVSPLDFTTPERAVIDMLSNLGMTAEEASNWLSDLSTTIKIPGFDACTTLLNKPLSAISHLIEI